MSQLSLSAPLEAQSHCLNPSEGQAVPILTSLPPHITTHRHMEKPEQTKKKRGVMERENNENEMIIM